MAIDSANVWNSTNPWAIPNTNALVSGLSYASQTNPAASVADPTSTPTTSNPTSASRMLGTAVPDTSAVPRGGTLAQAAITPVAQTPALGTTLASLGTQNKLTVSQGPALGAPLAQAATPATAMTYTGPQTVAAPSPTGNGWYIVYGWDQSRQGYKPIGQYNPAAHHGMSMDEHSTAEWAPPAGVVYSGTALTSGPSFTNLGADQINQQYSQAIDAYKGGAATAQADANAAAQKGIVDEAVAYMTAHDGQMNPNMVLPAAAVTAAQTAYQQQQAANGTAFSINGASGALPVNTTTADIAGVGAQNAITSQYNTNLGGADAGAINRAAAFAHANQAGQNQITHDTAAAASFNDNLAQFGNALQAQATIDTNATGQKLNQDIQRVGDIAASLEQQIQNLDATTQQQVKGQIDNLQAQVNYYNQLVQQYGSDVGWIMNIGKGILAAGAAVAAAATGGASGVALGVAAAGAAASTAK